jgi:hypothetical protein
MAYLTCPWCLTPQLIADEADEYKCYTCTAEVRFFQCPNCSAVQSVNKRWRAFICGRCNTKVDLPHRWVYDRATTAIRVEVTGKSWPPL